MRKLELTRWHNAAEAMNESERRSRRAHPALLVLGWLFLAGIAALMLAPNVPHTLLGWIVFVVAAPPLYLAGEMAAEKYVKYVSGWGERNIVQKVLKVGALVAMALVFLLAMVVLGIGI